MYTMGFHSALKGNEITAFAEKCMKLGNNMSGYISLLPEDQCCLLSLAQSLDLKCVRGSGGGTRRAIMRGQERLGRGEEEGAS